MASVLVVGSDRAVRRLMARILEIDGHRVLQAPDRHLALGLAEAVAVDLLVMDGPRAPTVERELIANLGAGGQAWRGPILIVGHAVETDERLGAHRAPFEEDEILHAARELLGRRTPGSAPERSMVVEAPGSGRHDAPQRRYACQECGAQWLVRTTPAPDLDELRCRDCQGPLTAVPARSEFA
jgi:CheY-like chemotaxis protein